MRSIKRIVLLLLTLSIVGIVFVNLGNYYKKYGDTYSGDKFTDINIDITKLVGLSVRCTEEVDSIIPVSTTFDLNFDSSVDMNYVKDVIKIEPQTEYEIEKVNSKYYKLKTIKPLLEGKIYNIIQTTTEGTEKWAFQTERDFKVTNYYPSKTGNRRSTIDLYFNTMPKYNIVDYISIEPPIEGNWEISNNMVIFKHTNEFEINTEYTVTVKKGAESKDNSSMLNEDFKISFYVQDSNAPDIAIKSANAFKTTENIEFDIYLYDSAINFDEYSLKVLNLKNKENFVNALKNEDILKEIKMLWGSEEYDTVYSQKIIAENSELTNGDRQDFCTSKIGFNIDSEGYFVAIVKYGEYYKAKCIQINNYSVTCNVLKNNDLLILVKGLENKNNIVDVYINEQKIGTTDNDGLLFIEDYTSLDLELDKSFNYIEFNATTPIILSTESAIYLDDYNYGNKYSQFNNGYLYTDRETYDVDETIHFWGFAKNRVKEVEKAELIIRDDYSEIKRVVLNLNEKDCFTYDYKLENINSGSYLFCSLLIDGEYESSRYLRVLDYSTKNYDIQMTSDKQEYMNGETAIVTINAQTYDGIKLKELEFNYEVICSYMNQLRGTVKTDANGMVKIEVPLEINATENYSKVCTVRILNSLVDGEQSDLTFHVYPYKNTVNTKTKYILDTNTYKLELNEYNVLNKNIPGNSKVIIEAIAYREEKYISNSYYDEYAKEMVNVYSTREILVPENHKTTEVEMINGKGVAYFQNWSQNYETEKYKFNIYIETEAGKRLFDERSYYISTYLTENDEEPYNNGEERYSEGYSMMFVGEQYNSTVKFGDIVNTALIDEDGNAISDYSNIEIYTYMLSGKGVEIIKTNNQKLSFEYTEEMGNNISIYSVIYDGNYAYSVMDYFAPEEMYINKDEVKLTLEVTFDKEIYNPGETAIITVKTLDHGKPISAGVNIAAVDTAFIDANGDSEASIVYALENYYYYYAQEISTHKFKNIFEGGGGGGDGEPRINLVTTAIFENIVTDENGEAQVKVQLPENITEWTITSQAISDNFKVAKTTQKIKVNKDFYVDMTHLDSYLENEKFEINIKSFSKTLDASQIVKYTLSIMNENNDVVEESSFEGEVNNAVAYKIENNLKMGQYKIKLSGEYQGKKDAVIEKINVVDNLLTVTHKEEISLAPDDKVIIDSNKGALYISNNDVSKVIKELFNLISLNDYRSDSKAISKEARRILNALYINELNFAREDNFYISNALKLMENSNEDVELALRILSIGSAKNGYTNELLNRLEVIASKEAFLWASVNAGRTVLQDLRKEKELIIQEILEASNNASGNEEITISRSMQDVLYIALGLADIGDYSNAKELYEIIKNKVTIEDVKNYELFTMLAIKLNMSEREEIYSKYLKLDMPPENEDFVKLYYIQNEINRNFASGKLVLEINGDEKEIDVKNIGVTRVVIAKEDNVVVKEISDNVAILLEDSKGVDFEKYSSNGYIVSKEYVQNNSLGGNLYTVIIKIDAEKLYTDKQGYSFRLEDVISNNMTFVSYDGDLGSYLQLKDGQKLIINCMSGFNHNNQMKKIIEVKYTARKTNEGEQIEAGTILVNNNGEIIDVLK